PRRTRGRAGADRRVPEPQARGGSTRRVRRGAAAGHEPALGPPRGHRHAALVGTRTAPLGAGHGAVHREPPALRRRRAARERRRQEGRLLMRSLGVLLAGGRGTRMGAGTPKALVVCGGRTLLARARATLETLCDAVVVVAPRELELPVPLEDRVDDPPGARGPLAAMLAGLAS